jgi:spore coat protein H
MRGRSERVAVGIGVAAGLLACGDAPQPLHAAGQAGSTAAAGDGSDGASAPGDRSLPGQRLFAGREVLEVRLTIDAAALTELEEHGDREEYLPASVQLARAGMESVDVAEVGLRHKGSYSLHHCWDQFGGVRSHEAECAKLSWKLKFDEYDPEARFDGLKRLNLHASSTDASKLHELLAYQTFRDFGVDAPRALPARVLINGQLSGLYIAVEEVDGRYTAAHFPEGPDGNLYKEIWPSSRATDQDFVAALQTNEERADVTAMRAFTAAVQRSTSGTLATELEPFVRIESLLRYIAVDRALRNWDGIMAFYSPTSPHNFFWYHADGPEPLFHLIPWDLDSTFWPFDPYMAPEQWVTAPPMPNFNERPIDCNPRVVWEPTGSERLMPPRCDRLLDALAEGQWSRLVEIGHELAAGPLAPARLAELADDWTALLEPLIAEDPTIQPLEWQRGLDEFRGVIAASANDFEAFLAEGLLDEVAPNVPAEPAVADLLAVTTDSGLHVSAVTNFEFAAPPETPEPAGVYAYADPLATFAASWSQEAPISGTGDLRLDFTFNRGPDTYDEWTGIGIACVDTDVTPYSRVVVWLSADIERQVRIRVASSAYADLFGGVASEFGVDDFVGPEPRAFVIDFADLYYPSWAKDDWTEGQGFSGTDAEALAQVLERFSGLVFGPAASVDPAGELSSPTETGFLRIDNIYFR